MSQLNLTKMTERFWSRIEKKENGCWEWKGAHAKEGYGFLRAASIGFRRIQTHRFAYILAHGPIADGLCVLHKCDNPPCCNPEHLFLGTRSENSDDKTRKGRVPKGDTHTAAKLNVEKVIQLRSEYRAGGISMAALGEKYGVHFNTIKDCINRRTWKSVADG